MKWLDTIETMLDLRHIPHTTNSTRMARIIRAIWFRPNSLQTTSRSQGNWLLRLFLVVLKILLLAIKDVLRPFWISIGYLLAPLKWTNKKIDLLLDLFAEKFNPGAPLQNAGRFLQKNKLILAFILFGASGMFLFVAQASLPLIGQWVFVGICYIAARFFKRLPEKLAHLSLMVLTLLLLARYVFWRFTGSLDLVNGMESFLGYTLLLSEAYTWMILLLGFMQTAWPLGRKPVQLDMAPDQWPTIDVFIPTYNEPLSVVKPTIFAAKGMDWPVGKMTVYLLDDGHRPDFQAFAAQAGVEYISRPDNLHAKAGNINYALKHTQGEFIAIFDCDHIPCRSFLQTTMGWMLANSRNALVQTPHHFFSADPFERNYDMFREVPNEGELFYGLLQDSNDYWNAAFFCGSCAVIRRAPLEEVGGIAIETVTEDAHTSLKMHSLGYESVYLGTPQAAGLATESLAGHIGQRIRWARGMAQIFRTDNPFLKKGLSFFQRICYANAMLHFFYGIPRLIFLIMPCAFLFFEYHVLNAAALTIMSYALPQLIFANYTNSIIQGKFRRSFWSEVYETVLSWYIVLPTTIAFINPKYGKFNVTSKGGHIKESYFDSNIAKPYLILMIVNLFALGIGLLRLFIWNTHETGTVLMNLLWATINLFLLGAAAGVATEAPQKSSHHRVRMNIPASLHLPGGYTLSCFTSDYSSAGLGLIVSDISKLRNATNVLVGLNRGDREFLFPATLLLYDNGQVEAEFKQLTLEQEAKLIQCTFGRADAWLNWNNNSPEDQAVDGLVDVVKKGSLGYIRLYQWLYDGLVNGLIRLYTGARSKTQKDL